MAEVKPKVTLIGTTLARVDLEFIYEGECAECEGCTVRKACHNLKPGRRYRVVGVRKTHHACPLHLEGATAVEVVESSIAALVSADMAITNTRILFEPSCSRDKCEHFRLCNPEGVIPGEKYVVVRVLGNAPPGCVKGRSLQLVELRAV
ncbi:MAG TPA: UPF0179 family protein [Methanolinea sp.]|jgi:uncharacterized protein (UPF0179 family)|nr:MAG: hypothetical protein A4E36_00079 [Methanoregulaceae archaeon PtaB.Bin009]OPY42385.1 MAG: hypothetical protein A4E41_00377 [Methanoregulaceae archaeon PtaU1.Bin066]HII77074.1 UPF0179 family protein [Methanolinea sp.]HNQ29701.1 UPF0179 family protein [Methanolinea sp.]HNS82894.1 UPF0179 family protein [Methanolinea sp.]